MSKLYKVIRIDQTAGTIELAGQMNNGDFFNKGFLYSYSQEFVNAKGVTTNAVGWVCNDDGTIKIQQGGIYEAMYERKKEGQQYDTLKMIKLPETTPPPRPPQPHPAQQVINQNAAKANSEKETALIIAATFLSGKGYTDWQEFKSMLGTVLPAVEQDIKAMLR